MSRARAPWWKRRLGRYGAVCALLIVASVVVGVAFDRTDPVVAVQLGLLGGAAGAYLLGLVRSPD